MCISIVAMQQLTHSAGLDPTQDGIVEIPAELFAVPPRLDLLHRVVVWQRREWWQVRPISSVQHCSCWCYHG